MPKKSKEINPFDGGWNNFADPRDIEENESAVLVNLSSLKKGQLFMHKNWKTVPMHTGTGTMGEMEIVPHRGLFVYKRDFTQATPPVEGETTIYLIATNVANNLSLLVSMLDLTSTDNPVSIGNYGNASGSVAILPCFVESGGNVRIGDGSFEVSGSSGHTKFYGVLHKYKLNSNADPSFVNHAINERNYITSSLNGNVYTTLNEASPSPAIASNSNGGTVNLYIQKTKSYQTDQVTYTGSGNTQPTMIIGSYANPNTLGSSYNHANSSSFNSNNDIDVSQGGFVNQMRKRASDNVWSDTYLYGPGETSAGAYFCAVASYNTANNSNQSAMLFHTENEIFSFVDKSISVPIWVAADTFSRLETIAFKIHIGSSNVNGYSFHITSSQITSAETWITLECVYGNHDETYGDAINPNNFKSIEVEIFNSHATNWDVTSDNALWGFNYAIGVITLGTPNQGQWTGNYLFYYNWIYDRTQHSKTFKFANQGSDGLIANNDILEFMPYVVDGSTVGEFQRDDTSGSAEATARITGANIFFSEIDSADVDIDKDKKFLMELNFDSGARTSLFDVYTAWNPSTTNTGYKLASSLSLKSSAVIDSFSTVAGYSEGDKLEIVDFATGIMLNNRMYVGNVKIYESASKYYKYPDRIYKSLPNQPDVFTKHNYLEVAPNDGDAITALSSYGDFLLEFKANDMHLINVTQDVEYLEEGYRFAGAWSESAVCKVGKGVAWVNRNGLFFFDGKEVTNLLGKKMNRDTWYTDMGAKPIITYAPLEDQVHVIANGTHEAFVYSFVNESFEKYIGANLTNTGVLAAESESASGSSVTLTVDTVNATDALFLNKKVYKSDGTLFGTCTAVNSTTEIVFGGGLENAITNNDNLHTITISGNIMTKTTVYSNAITEPDGNLTILESNNSNNTDMTRWSAVGSANNYISLESKDHDLGDPARQKSLKKVYITYKINSTDVPTIQYKKDNGTARSFDTAFTNTSDAWTTIGIKPSTSSEANNGFSFQILIAGETHSSFAINDINMIYREKSVK